MKRSLFVVLVLLFIAGNAWSIPPAGTINTFWTGAQDSDWDNPANWRATISDGTVWLDYLDPVVPASDRKASIQNSTATPFNPTISDGMVAATKELPLGDGGTSILNVTGGSLTASNWLIVAYGPSDVGTLNVSGGVVDVKGGSNDMTVGFRGTGYMNISDDGLVKVGDRFHIGRDIAEAVGYLEMTGGRLEIKDDFYAGDIGTANITMSAGEIEVIDDRFYLGNNATGEGNLTMTGGLIKVNTLMAVGRAGAKGTIQLDGGTIELGGQLELGNASIDITEGKILIGGDRVTEGTSWNIISKINAGVITGYGDKLNVRAVYDAELDKTIVTAVPEPATICIMALGGLGLIRRRRRS